MFYLVHSEQCISKYGQFLQNIYFLQTKKILFFVVFYIFFIVSNIFVFNQKIFVILCFFFLIDFVPRNKF